MRPRSRDGARVFLWFCLSANSAEYARGNSEEAKSCRQKLWIASRDLRSFLPIKRYLSLESAILLVELVWVWNPGSCPHVLAIAEIQLPGNRSTDSVWHYKTFLLGGQFWRDAFLTDKCIAAACPKFEHPFV